MPNIQTTSSKGTPTEDRPRDKNRRHQHHLPGIPYRPSQSPDPDSNLISIYKPLGAESFRLLRLHGYSDHGVVQCSFEHVPFPTSTSSTNFIAISYTWSSADRFWYGKHDNSPKQVIINNENVQVTDKVANILNLMLRTGRRNIWIDALSINQADNAEKTVQVAQMHFIYGCMLELLRDTKGWNQCADARDILYSKRALVTDAWALLPQTDYSTSVEVLYRDFAKANIMHYGNLEIIGFAARARNKLSLPSWVPNWTAASRQWVPQRCSRIPSVVYPEQSYPPIISDDGLELIVKGRIVDRITTSRFRNLERLIDNNAFSPSDHGLPQQIYFHPSELPDTDDVVCILQGFRTFVYLRPDGNGYRLVGRDELCQNWIQGGKFDFFRLILMFPFRKYDPYSHYLTSDLDDPSVLAHALSCPEVEFRIR